MGEPDKLSLRAALESEGWDVTQIECNQWWAYEVWRLTSNWRPVGAEAHITFLVDPQLSDGRSSRASDVWAIGVSRDAPHEHLEAQRADISVSPWPKRMAEIVASAAALRPAS